MFLFIKQCSPHNVSLSQSALNSPGIILDAAQGQTESHVPTQLLRRSHESLQVVLHTATQSGDWHAKHWQVLHLTFFFGVCYLWLTVKYWMISGLLLDFSSTSVNTSSTSRAGRKNKSASYSWYRIYRCDITPELSVVTLDRLSSWHLFQVHCHVSCTQWNRGWYVDERQGTSGQVIW